jgi:uncharacterized protein (DUF1501 family)
MRITRRVFLRDGALAVVGTAALPGFLTRSASAGERLRGHDKRFILIFQRGAADGLNVVVPHAEASYYAVRPTIQVPRGAELDLDGFFGLHPSLAPLKPLWDEKRLAFVHAAGSPDPTRSHFDAQDFMESGTPGRKATTDGWLNRALRSAPADRTAFRALALGPSLPRILLGEQPAVAVSNIREFGVGGGDAASADAHVDTIEAMYAHDGALQVTAHETIEAVRMLKAADPARYAPAAAAKYPAGQFGESLKQLAQLIKADLGVQVAFADIGGWDHHVNEGNTQGRLPTLLHEFAQALRALWIDLGDLADSTVIVTMSEFGRTAAENGNRGTDHGHANVMFMMGGPVQGGRAYGHWPGLDKSQLYEGRDLAVTTDFRAVLGEALVRHLGLGGSQLEAVFPGFANDSAAFPGYLSAREK